ncbi:MAG: translation initiation factor IF-2 [Patescibacteria group bacterium]
MSTKIKQANIKTNTEERPPVVAILGHIDHGKTTLLDYIRKTDIAARESGGITQHIGAYEIIHTTSDGRTKKITFIDTPGHEAFSQMRSRGARVADIAILVVAADEGVKPQTLEALEHIQKSGATLVVALNKMDRPEAKPERVKQQLAEKSVLLEGWGGTVPNHEISAKTGKGVAELLDLILLVSELEELRADPTASASGVIIEAHKDPRRGITATLLVKEGTIAVGDCLVAGTAAGKVKSMADANGGALEQATFSAPVAITGFDALPAVGDAFSVVPDKRAAEEKARAASLAHVVPAPGGRAPDGKKILAVILKADVTGTREALEQMIAGIVHDEVVVQLVKSDTGEVNEGDIALAKQFGAMIAAFKTKVPGMIAKLAASSGVRILEADVIYGLVDRIKEECAQLLAPQVTRTDIGTLSVLALFKTSPTGMIVGGKVTKGKAEKGVKADVRRGGTTIFVGKISQLQHNKKDVSDVELGRECGMMITPVGPLPPGATIAVGDELTMFAEEMRRQTIA